MKKNASAQVSHLTLPFLQTFRSFLQVTKKGAQGPLNYIRRTYSVFIFSQNALLSVYRLSGCVYGIRPA